MQKQPELVGGGTRRAVGGEVGFPGLRALMPRRSSWRVAQFDTLRLRLIKTAARVVEMKSKIKIHLPTSAPDQAIWHLAIGRLPRLIR